MESISRRMLRASRYHCLLWKLTPIGMFPGSFKGCVAVKRGDGSPAVLKIHTTRYLGLCEMRALMHWQGRGVPSVLEADPANGAFLLERILPGRSLSATHAPSPERMARLLARLHATPFHGAGSMPALEDHFRLRLHWHRCALARAGRSRRNRGLISLARRGEKLCATCDRPVLLHGDFQEKNLVLGPRGSLVVLDPLPCIGDASFDVGLAASASRFGVPMHEYAARMGRVLGCNVRRACAWAEVLKALPP